MRLPVVTSLFTLFAPLVSHAGTAPVVSPAKALNPICPPGLHIADPSPRVMPDGRLYVYGSRDEPGNAWCSRSYDVLSTPDLAVWSDDAMSFSTAGPAKQTDYTDAVLYAPDAIFKNGRYYLYYCLATGGEDEGVAVADSPTGPFVKGRRIAGISGIDPAVFIDDDGRGYLYWGQGAASCAKLKPDMTDIDRSTIRHDIVVHRDSPYSEKPDAELASREHWFNEGSSVYKRNGIYYYVYAQGGRHGRGCCACLAYATAASPTGPFTYRGVIIDNFGSGPNLVNNHGGLVEFKGRWYVFYHRPTNGGASLRKACLEPIAFNPDGTIDEVPMTTQGANGPLDPRIRMSAARACLMSGNVRVREHRPAWGLVTETLDAIRDGDTAVWRFFDFTDKGVDGFTCKTAGWTLPGKIEIRLDKADGELIGECTVGPGAPDTAFAIRHAAVKPVTGTHGVVFVFKADAAGAKHRDLGSLDWFRFESASKSGS